MYMEIDAMVVFANIVEQGGITAAAKVMKLPKSNVSRRLAQLEHRLGVRLLERTTRKIHVTEIGQIYYQHCRRIVEEAEHADLSISRTLEVPRGTLRVSASVTVGQNLIGPMLPEFMKLFPDVLISLQLSNRRVDLIEEGFDLAIRVGALSDSSLISRRVGVSELGVYASPKYLRRLAAPVLPADLIDHDCLIMSDEETGHVWRLVGPSGRKNTSVRARAVVNDFAVLQRMLLDGIGIALLPDYIAHASKGKLTRVLPEWSIPSVELHAIYPSHRGATPKMRVFLDWVIDKMAMGTRGQQT